METKISVKNMYLLLVISIGLIGLGIGSTFAVFTATAEINNPISFTSSLSYESDVFSTTEITVNPSSSKTITIQLTKPKEIVTVKYATWYIYDGDVADLTIKSYILQNGGIPPSGTLSNSTDDTIGVIAIGIKNNTSNTITVAVGVATSENDIVLPSYMQILT